MILRSATSARLRERLHKGGAPGTARRRTVPRHLDPVFRRRGPAPPPTEGRRMDWRHRAACRDEDPELFFPIGTTGPALRQVEEAKAVCHRCLVVDDCLSWALDSGQDSGVWGGLAEEERFALKRRGVRALHHA